MGWREVWVREARRRAVEAAASWLAYEMSWSQNEAQYFVEGVLTAAERAMADAGWRMVRMNATLPPAPDIGHSTAVDCGNRRGR